MILNEMYGAPLNRAEIGQVYDLLGGHLFLTRLAFYKLICPDSAGVGDMVARAAETDGPFGDHLRAWLLKLGRQPKLLNGLRQILQHGTADEDAFYRLYSCGLVLREGRRIHISNVLYDRFFKSVL